MLTAGSGSGIGETTPVDERTVKFLSFDGCPLAPEALKELESAVDQLRDTLQIEIEHIDLMHADTADELKRWGSPTILLNEQDITGAQPGDANSCRIYPGPGGVPATQEIVDALSRAL